MSIRLTLPLPPSANKIYKPVKVAGVATTVKSREAREYREEVWHEVLAHGYRPTGVRHAPAAPLRVNATYYLGSRRKRDLDNLLKVMIDALAEALGFDDDEITEMYLRKTLDREHPRCEVEIRGASVGAKEEGGR